MQRTLDGVSQRQEAAGELDLGALGGVLKRRRRAIIVPTVLAFLLICLFVNVVTPRYTAESQVLLENQETFFTRPDRSTAPSEQASLVDPEAVGSQIQLVTSRDLARRAIKDLNLQGNPEFDPAARGMGALTRVLVLLGIAHDPTQDTVDARILQAFEDKLTVYSPPKTRVISIQFQSKDPELAARAANKMAELYIAEQSTAKRTSAKAAADALSGQIADLRLKLAKADAEREQYRLDSGLLAGSNNMTVSGQQLADINSDLSKARTTQADAQAKASMLRDLIRQGKTADVTEVINNDLVRRVGEQRVTAQAQLAQESRTLLPGHPRIKELTAQVADLNAALKAAAKQAASTLENESKIAGQRVANLETVLTQQKKVAGVANGDEVRLRSLDRIAQSYKDQLDSSTAKYQEALSRQTSMATPADARIIARAVEPQDPSYPKKLPFIIFGTVATLVFVVGLIIARELLAGPRDLVDEEVVAPPVAPRPTRREPPLAPATTVVAPVVAAPVEPAPASKERPAPTVTEAPPVVRAPKAREPGDAVLSSSAQLRQEVGFDRPARQDTIVLPPSRTEREPRTPWALTGLVERVKRFGQSAAASRGADLMAEASAFPKASTAGVGWDSGVAPLMPQQTRSPVTRPAPAERDIGEAVDMDDLAARIVAAHVPGRGLHVVGASLGSTAGATDELLALARSLAERGRSIIVDLNASPSNLAALAGVGEEGAYAVKTLPGLAELLSGSASFAEVIHRDQASRLHFIPTGMREADFRDFDLILDALSETYDFIVLLAPAFPRSDIAKVMAPYADFVVLTAAKEADSSTLSVLESELIEAGAQEVLVTGQFARAVAVA
ncbi:exopolysaccharide transport family protein [Beijerinckia sp. L45]|uniref:exopolysaccharide transport family protein n=1 Tax=Beijerinckia sp. L45 TaxID=1641855 RepID=UPI00131DEEEB|nr:exopolysaccharide transport family protein [Beijerinckia sp. L45]